jgi:hypothetical protein
MSGHFCRLFLQAKSSTLARVNLSRTTWMRLGICAGIICTSLLAVSVWNKHDFCQGWAKHYAARASELRAQAGALGRDEAREYLMSAELNQRVAEK